MQFEDGRMRWAARVPRNKIRRLYETDARGIVDQELIDEVGYTILVRCEDILTVTEASQGRVRCPECGDVVEHRWHREQLMECPGCSWSMTWGDYFKSYRKKQLHGGGAAAVGVWQDYVERFPKALSARDKMLLIDKIIHACHKMVRDGETIPTRPTAVNLIEGKMGQVVALLEDLAYGPAGTPSLGETREAWRRNLRDARRAWGDTAE